MNHDPFCKNQHYDKNECNCTLIHAVREDCAERVAGAYIVGYEDGKIIDRSHPDFEEYIGDWNSAITIALAYLRGDID